MRYVFACFLGLWLIGCGEDGVLIDGQSGEPLVVFVPKITPDRCWSTPPTELTIEERNELYRLTDAMYRAVRLTEVIAGDPSAPWWREESEDGVLVEGTVLTRGEDWGVAKMVALYRFDEEQVPLAFDADIDLMPQRTVIDFGHEVMISRESSIQLGDLVRGCSVSNGIAFERLGGAARCWSSRTISGLTGGSVPSPFGGGGVLTVPGRPDPNNPADCLRVIDQAIRW